MKKRSTHHIPDFSRRPSRQAPPPGEHPAQKVAPPPTPRPTVKPQMTSAKSGRRGQ
jgi:hypothetical protein